MSHHYLEELWSGLGDEISLYIRWNDARLIVYLSRSQTSTDVPSIDNTFLDRYNETCNNDDIDEAEALSDEILDAVVEAGRDTFDRVAPPPAPGHMPEDLLTLLFPKEYSFSFQALNGKAEVHCNLPAYSTKEIHVVESLILADYIALVQVEGKEMCSKAGDSKGEDATQRELDCLWKITKSLQAAAIQVPKLLGLITTPENGKTIGFLEEYIPVAETWELSTLGRIDDVSAIDESRRKKWLSQIQDTADLLHKIAITWGDGKASNVLIHRETDDAWVIDFGGGWTEGWVDEELSGTVEGDEVAVRKTMEYLQVS
ncbi:kinase-like (PK-like) [Fusarium subglutinans]|uniref:Kinase-like (PK-like) n=1 Tax=Gibberella subglutinans TaxID=42677 RepID=A0A8H5Q9A0_GIBSU|nr:kinase-like (PK-like) [Fusarium subglutinans]KAF5611235.1 kinase-like (PK-like) [Fusarium subglutinans]